METVGQRIKKCREARGLTQEDLAEAVGVSTEWLRTGEGEMRPPRDAGGMGQETPAERLTSRPYALSSMWRISMKLAFLALPLTISLGCEMNTAPARAPEWEAMTPAREAEYAPFDRPGTGALTGQAFLRQRGGGVVRASGREVTLDPDTALSREWLQKAGSIWDLRNLTHPSPLFASYRRTTTADADGRFTFRDLPAGKYLVRTEVTWEVQGIEGGLVWKSVDVRAGQNETILTR